MSIERSTKKLTINVQLMIQFFEQKGASAKCPVCRHENWEVPLLNGGGGSAIPWGTGDGNMFMSGMAIVTMVCTNCFYVRQHSLGKRHLGFILEETTDDNQADE